MNFHLWPRLHTLHLTLLGNLIPAQLNWIPKSLVRALPEMRPTSVASSSSSTSITTEHFCSLRRVVLEIWLSHPSQLDNPVWNQAILILHRLVAGGRGVRKIVVLQRGTLGLRETREAVENRVGSLREWVETCTDWNDEESL